MKKYMLRLVYLTRETEARARTTSNINAIVNKIPCEEEEFFKATSAEMHVIKELQEYPINEEITDSEESQEELDLFDNKKMFNIYKKVEEFTTDFNYLPIQEARLYLRELNKDEIKEYRESLTQIKQLVSDTLVEEQLNDYVIQEI
jgi:hypothetical protein